ncbi:MAG TPA: sensor domain-containing diguanylate cyclase [Burkholderiales bacterium]|nr:sensor domain-containing diguanylate cyclase [Burkholderiales bacterium]
MAAPGGNKRSEAVIGAALALLGAAVAAGWFMRNRGLVQLATGLTPMVLNTAVCFVLSGAWLMLGASSPDHPRPARLLAGALLALSAAVTLQYILGTDFGIDASGLHRWLPAGSAHPGRMSAFTGAAFIAASLAMLLTMRPSHPGRDTLALALTTVSGGVGVAALLGYLFELHLVYPGYPLGLVAPHTGAGLIAVAAALWLRLVRERRVHFWQRLAVENRITLASAAILSLLVLAVAVGVFATLEARVTQALSDEFTANLRYRVLLAQAVIESGLQRSRILAGRPAPTRLLRRRLDHPDDAEARAQLEQSASSLLADGYLAAAYYDAAGREIAAAGRRLEHPALAVPLRGVAGATLAWDGGFVVSGRYSISDDKGPVGEALVQTPLPALGTLLNDSYRLGKSGESGMCAQIGEQLGCFPQLHVPKVYFVPTHTAGGALLPMTRGVRGESDVLLTTDYRGENVLAAYAPVGAFGLAMVVKMDTAEIYSPVRERLQILLPALVLLIGAGTFLLRIGVQPLAARLAQSEREALERHHALEAMMANVADGIMLLDADGTIRSWNAAAESLFGYEMSEIVGRNVSTLVPEELRESNIASTRRFLATGQSNVVGRGNLSYPALRKDGSRFELEFAVTTMGSGRTPQMVAVFRDITERKAAEHRLSRLALHDALTGLPNRASFERRVDEALPRRRRGAGQLAIMIMDIDRFKSINDSLGHAGGDHLLVAFARRLQASLRENDLVSRFGGDEFTVVAENLKGQEDAASIADKMLAAMREPFDIEGRALAVTVSIGIAIYRDGDTSQTLMKRADEALYEAKGAGRARYHLAE